MISYMCMNFWPGKDKLWWTNCLRPLPIRLFGVSLRGSLSSLNFYMRLYSTSPWCRSRQPQDDKILISKQTFHHFVRCSKYQTVRIKHEYYRLLSSVSFFAIKSTFIRHVVWIWSVFKHEIIWLSIIWRSRDKPNWTMFRRSAFKILMTLQQHIETGHSIGTLISYKIYQFPKDQANTRVLISSSNFVSGCHGN